MASPKNSTKTIRAGREFMDDIDIYNSRWNNIPHNGSYSGAAVATRPRRYGIYGGK